MENPCMTPKTVNAFGCCCSRNIFNFAPASKAFKINRFAFQIAVWACFQPSLEIPFSDIEKIKERPFTLRMIDYDFNKIACREFEKLPSEYFMLDLTSMSFPVYKIRYKNKETYVQNWLGSKFMPTLKDIPGFETFSYQQMTIEDVPQDIVFDGLDRFCEWLLGIYKPEKILFYLPRRAERYLLANGETGDFSEALIKQNRNLDEIVRRYTNYVRGKLKGCHFMQYTRPLMAYDAECGNNPPPALHYAPSNYVEQGQIMMNLLDLRYSDYVGGELNPWDSVIIEREQTLQNLTSQTQRLEQICKNGVFVNINYYFKLLRLLKNMDDYILFFVCKEDMAVLLDQFTEREKLGLKQKPSFKDSYIAILDGKDGLVYEEVKASRLQYQYSNSVFTKPVQMISGGTNCIAAGENVIASVIIEDQEYAYNSRGCNVVVFQKSTKSVVDSFVCDLNRDELLGVRSRYAENYIQKILCED